MTETQGRARCDRCLYLSRQCVCRWIPTVSTTLKVLVLQDCKEAKHAKNTVSLLRLALPSVRCIEMVNVDSASKALSSLSVDEWYLVFPVATGGEALEPMPSSKKKLIKGIILLDATWRKAKKMFFNEPKLHAFQSVYFAGSPKSRYDIRKSPFESALSTLEACAYSIEVITGESMKPLNDFMVNAQKWQWRNQPVEHRH